MKKRSIKRTVVPVFVCLIGFGLITACGSNENTEMTEDNGMATSERPAMEEQQGSAETQTFKATLEGSNQVQEVETDAQGTVTVTLQGDSIHVEGQFSNLSSDFAGSHIHQGAEGENGSAVLSLEPTLGNDKRSGSWDASYALNESQISALKAGSLYVNLHSAEHKAGEIRGQLTSSGSGM